MMTLIKDLIIIAMALVTFKFVDLHIEKFAKTLDAESKVPLDERYENSKHFKHFLSKEPFLKLSERMPEVSSFLLGMDPTASKAAIYRWVFTALLGWFYFCFFSSFAKGIYKYGVTNLQLFFFPLGYFLALACAGSIGRLALAVTPTSPIARLFDALLIWTAGISFLVFLAISVLSIPVSLLLAFFRVNNAIFLVIRDFASTVRRKKLGNTLSAEAVETIPVADSGELMPWWRREQLEEMKAISCKNSQSIARNGTVPDGTKPAALPGPIVKRKLIDGVWYDEA